MSRNKGVSGFTLIEVLITLLILSVGLLGLAALQAHSLQYNQGAYLRSQANILAYDIVDRMRINRDRALAGAYNVSYSDDASSGTALEEKDLAEWLALLSSQLPSGDGEIACSAASCKVKIKWQEAGVDDPFEFEYETRL